MLSNTVRDTLHIDVFSMGQMDARLVHLLPCFAFLGTTVDIRRDDGDNLRVQVRFENGGVNRRTHLHRFRRLLMLLQRGFVMRRRLQDLGHHAFRESVNGVILLRWHVEINVAV